MADRPVWPLTALCEWDFRLLARSIDPCADDSEPLTYACPVHARRPQPTQ